MVKQRKLLYVGTIIRIERKNREKRSTTERKMKKPFALRQAATPEYYTENLDTSNDQLLSQSLAT